MCYHYLIINKSNSVKKQFSVLISGQVQGVCFRYEARDLAEKLQITGFIENMPSGTVKIVAEGEEKNIKEFKKWCQHGPPIAKIEKIEVLEKIATDEFNTFEIRT